MNQTVTGPNGVTLITQVIPSNGQYVIQMGPTTLQNTLCQIPQGLQKFFKGEPKTLGVIQIVIGLMHISLGVILSSTVSGVAVATGIFFLSSVIFIISGSLSVAAQNKANMCLVKGSLGMNIVSSAVALIGIILISLDLALLHVSQNICSPSYENYKENCINLLTVIHGIDGVFLLLLLLVFCISISTSAFGCKATCCSSNSDKRSDLTLSNEFRPEMISNPVPPPMYNGKDQYRPEASFSSAPAAVYTESSQYRPESPAYSEIDSCRPLLNSPLCGTILS